MSTATDNVGLYRKCLTAGNEGTPGAPSLHLSLLVNATNGSITGEGKITQAVAPPAGDTPISDIQGRAITISDIEGPTTMVSLRGTAFVSFPPPAIGSYLAPVEAHFSGKGTLNDPDWSGTGTWELRGQPPVENVAVKSVPC